jgi:hypothetical protein
MPERTSIHHNNKKDDSPRIKRREKEKKNLKEFSIRNTWILQHRNIRAMKKQGNMIPLKACNTSISESEDTEMVEIPEKEFNFLKENSNKQIDEVRKPVEKLQKKVSNMDE